MILDYNYFLDLVKRLNRDTKGSLSADEIEEYADDYYLDYVTSLHFGEVCGVIEDVLVLLADESQYNNEYEKDLENIKKSIDNSKKV